MKVTDIITLGKMGYTKKDIDSLTQEENTRSEKEESDLAKNIAQLQKTVDSALSNLQIQNTRSEVTTDSGSVENRLEEVNQALSKLMGVNDGQGENSENRA